MSVYNCGEERKNLRDIPLNRNVRNRAKNPLESLDRDTLLTAAVLLLMVKNGGDMRLILALGYIIAGGEMGK
ncbi:MAG: hypothetical protein IKJ60_04625 [Ruminococcus sp.]|nr:hypothetical protein [Ruminococcus sp.]